MCLYLQWGVFIRFVDFVMAKLAPCVKTGLKKGYFQKKITFILFCFFLPIQIISDHALR